MHIVLSKRAAWKLKTEVHNLAMVTSFWAKKKKKKKDDQPYVTRVAVVTQNRGQWPSRLHSSAPAVIRGLYPGSDILRQVCFSCLLQQLWKRHVPYLNHEHC